MKKTISRQALLLYGMGFFLLASLATLINVLLFPYAREYHEYDALPIFAALFLALCGFVFLGRKLRGACETKLLHARRIAVPAYLAALFCVHILLGYLMEYVPAGDNFMLYNASQLLAIDGHFERYPDFGLYLARFSNQWGFLMMLTLFWKLMLLLGIRARFMALVLVQAVLYTVGILSALRIIRRFRGVRGELMLLAMLGLCFPLYLAAAVLYTDTFSLPFVLLALDLALRIPQETSAKKQLLLSLACGAVALIGGQIKMTVAIVLIAAVICFFLTMKPLRAALCGGLCVLMLTLGTTAVQQAMLGPVIDPAVYDQQNTPTIHWIMMSIPTGNNPYGNATGDYGITWGMMDEGASHEEVMDSIYTRMKDRIYTLRYPNRLLAAMMRKNAAAMGDGTFGMSEMLDDNPVRENAVSSVVLSGRQHYALYSAICTGVFMAHLLLSLCGCAHDMKKRDTSAAMLYVAAFGVMLFLLIWEARSRYLFNFVPVFLLLSSMSMIRCGKEGMP